MRAALFLDAQARGSRRPAAGPTPIAPSRPASDPPRELIAMELFADGCQDISDASNALPLAPSTLAMNLLRNLAQRFSRHADPALTMRGEEIRGSSL